MLKKGISLTHAETPILERSFALRLETAVDDQASDGLSFRSVGMGVSAGNGT